MADLVLRLQGGRAGRRPATIQAAMEAAKVQSFPRVFAARTVGEQAETPWIWRFRCKDFRKTLYKQSARSNGILRKGTASVPLSCGTTPPLWHNPATLLAPEKRTRVDPRDPDGLGLPPACTI